MEWEEAEDYLKSCEEGYASIGTAGTFALTCVIMPLRDRFNAGERSQELYDDIMEVSL